MRRGLTATVGTVLGTVLLIGAKLGHPAEDAGGAEAGAERTAAAAIPTASTSAVPVPKMTASATARPSVRPSKTATNPRAGALQDGSFAGPGVSERYGTIKVTIVVSDGRISSVGASCSCSGRSRSISNSAFTQLEPRVLTAQSANVQSVSGATYTYEAYKQSLAAAINDAKA